MAGTNKRLLIELKNLQNQQYSKQNLLDNDYLIFPDDQDMNIVYTIIKAPEDSVYRHKFIRLDFKMPQNYPFEPPVVTFINYDGVRIHPNMYEDGKCCLTILNTWPSEKEKWESTMGIETILLAFLSFLDNTPYVHEPGGRDDNTYTGYVIHQTYKSCLLRYIQFEKISLFRKFIFSYLMVNIDYIFNDLRYLSTNYDNVKFFYTSCFEIYNYTINYDKTIQDLSYYYNYLDYDDENDDYDLEDFDTDLDLNNLCTICLEELRENKMKLECNHFFHKTCITKHLKIQNHCPVCRKDNVWMINPLTKRRIKFGSRTHKRLIEEKVL